MLVPCFLGILAAAGCMWYVTTWSDEIMDGCDVLVEKMLAFMRMIFPTKWQLDEADDEDLAKEGVNTSVRQALILAT